MTSNSLHIRFRVKYEPGFSLLFETFVRRQSVRGTIRQGWPNSIVHGTRYAVDYRLGYSIGNTSYNYLYSISVARTRARASDLVLIYCACINKIRSARVHGAEMHDNRIINNDIP